jgi:hypothetical protein
MSTTRREVYYITAKVRPLGRRVKVSRPIFDPVLAKAEANRLRRLSRRQKPSVRYYSAIKIESY